MIIKNIWDKIYFHPLFYMVVFLSLITANFKKLFIFTLIIIIHELGHTITGLLLGIKLNRIEIYPYGGCSKLEYDVNIKLLKELLIVIMGPIIQIIFTLILSYLKIDNYNYFYHYSMFILIFNLLPIYPLDGGKIINILLSFFISYYKSLKVTYYISYFILTLFIFITLFFNKNLVIFLIVFSLILEVFKELKKISFYFNKFLLERYINNYRFKYIKKINSIYKMKRDYYHLFIIDNIIISERKYLDKYYKSIEKT